jgi:hypothetical protein
MDPTELVPQHLNVRKGTSSFRNLVFIFLFLRPWRIDKVRKLSGLECAEPDIKYITVRMGRTRWRSWLRHCATSWKVADSIPDGVIGRTMALGSTQSLTEMSARNIFWG